MKRFGCLLLILALLLGLSGCTSGQGEDSAKEPTAKVLRIMAFQENLGSGKIYSYLPDYTLEYVTDYPDGTTLLTEIMSGSGPDIINGTMEYGTQMDLNLLRTKGVAADLLPLLEQSGLDLSIFQPSVLEACKKGGGLYYIPIESWLNTLSTTQETLDDLGISVTTGMTADEFFEQALPIAETLSISGQSLFGGLLDFRELLLFSGFQLMDYEGKTAYADTDAFRSLAEIYKKLSAFEPRFDYSNQAISEYYSSLKSGDVKFTCMITSLKPLISYEYLLKDSGRTPVVFPFPTARRGQAPSLAIGQAYSILESSPTPPSISAARWRAGMSAPLPLTEKPFFSLIPAGAAGCWNSMRRSPPNCEPALAQKRRSNCQSRPPKLW